jgi:hypothetical protein
VNPYRLPRFLVLIPAALCTVAALALVFGERADIAGLGWEEHPLLLLASVIGAVVTVPLYRWLHRKEDRWELADLPGWEEEVQAETSEVPIGEPADFWGRFWPAFFAIMAPPVGIILSIRAVRKASTTDRPWAIGSLAIASILTAVSIIAITQG